MAVFTAIVLTTLLFEDDDFIVFDLVDNSCLDRSARHGGGADLGIAFGADEQDLIKRDGVAFFSFQQFDMQNVVFLDAILFSTGFNDCVHGMTVSFQAFNLIFQGGKGVQTPLQIPPR